MEKVLGLIEDEKKRLAEKGIQGTMEEHKTWLKNTMKKLFAKHNTQQKQESYPEFTSVLCIRSITAASSDEDTNMPRWQNVCYYDSLLLKDRFDTVQTWKAEYMTKAYKCNGIVSSCCGSFVIC
jgi:hypothetical protein